MTLLAISTIAQYGTSKSIAHAIYSKEEESSKHNLCNPTLNHAMQLCWKTLQLTAHALIAAITGNIHGGSLRLVASYNGQHEASRLR
jgi:hypothetical protein